MSDIVAIVRKYERVYQCNCDLDNWQPTGFTGHSHVCIIHKAAVAQAFAEDYPNAVRHP